MSSQDFNAYCDQNGIEFIYHPIRDKNKYACLSKSPKGVGLGRSFEEALRDLIHKTPSLPRLKEYIS